MTEHTLTAFDEVAALRRAADAARMAGDHAAAIAHDLATLRRAAEIARDSDQYEAAIAHYDVALEVLADRLIPPDPLTEYELRSSRAACYHATSEYPPETEDLRAMARLA